jgi:hypothetical protein
MAFNYSPGITLPFAFTRKEYGRKKGKIIAQRMMHSTDVLLVNRVERPKL